MAAKRKSTKTAAKKPAAASSAAPAGMGAAQKTIYNKLRKKGMSPAQASAFSKQAARRKAGASKSTKAPRKSGKR
jgi:hypothetical protein